MYINQSHLKKNSISKSEQIKNLIRQSYAAGYFYCVWENENSNQFENMTMEQNIEKIEDDLQAFIVKFNALIEELS